jgi:hypothetical protein
MHKKILWLVTGLLVLLGAVALLAGCAEEQIPGITFEGENVKVEVQPGALVEDIVPLGLERGGLRCTNPDRPCVDVWNGAVMYGYSDTGETGTYTLSASSGRFTGTVQQMVSLDASADYVGGSQDVEIGYWRFPVEMRTISATIGADALSGIVTATLWVSGTAEPCILALDTPKVYTTTCEAATLTTTIAANEFFTIGLEAAASDWVTRAHVNVILRGDHTAY